MSILVWTLAIVVRVVRLVSVRVTQEAVGMLVDVEKQVGLAA